MKAISMHKGLTKALLLVLLSFVTVQAAIPPGFSLPAPAYAPRQNSDTTGTNTIWVLWGQAPTLASPNFVFNGYIGLSGLTNRLTIADGSLLLDGFPIGGVTSYISNLFVTNLTVNNLTVLTNASISNLFVTEVIVTNNITINGNTKASNFFALTVVVTNNLTALQNTYTSNLFALTLNVTNNATFFQNAYFSNLYALNFTFSNNITGTIDPTQTGLTVKQRRSLKLQFPRKVDGSGCIYSNTNDYTALTFMVPRFSGSAATNVNNCSFAFRVPSDLDTTVDLTASLHVRLSGADTSASTYTVGMASVSNSADWEPTAINFVTLTVPADAGGGSGNVESVNGVTLTSWRSSLVANEWWYVLLQRDGVNDSSNVAHDFLELEIFYTSTQ